MIEIPLALLIECRDTLVKINKMLAMTGIQVIDIISLEQRLTSIIDNHKPAVSVM